MSPETIQRRVPDPDVRRDEWRFARSSVAILLIAGTATTILAMTERLRVGLEPIGHAMLLLQLVLVVVGFEAYYYAIHRLLHTRMLFRRVHAVHHRSKSPRLLSALSWHPVEAMLIAGYLPVVMAVTELHLGAIASASVFLSTSIALAHSGREIVPPALHRVPVLGWWVTPLVHDAHHARSDVNYGASLNLFDRLLGTFRAPEEAR